MRNADGTTKMCIQRMLPKYIAILQDAAFRLARYDPTANVTKPLRRCQRVDHVKSSESLDFALAVFETKLLEMLKN